MLAFGGPAGRALAPATVRPAPMLETLYVKDFAIVGEADIAFGPGMTAVTGETGAGKSLLVDALLLLTGSRADSSVVRHGCERAELAAEFDLAARPDLRDWLVAEDLDEDGACHLRRVIRSEGSSRAWINGRPVTLGQLKTFAATLVGIHGQHEHQSLLDRASQLALLDAFGGHAGALTETARHARAWRAARDRIEALSRGGDHAERIEWLAHQVDELDREALEPDELDSLEEEHRRLANAGRLLQGCAALEQRLDGDDEHALLRIAARAQAEAAHLASLDSRLAPLGELLESARIQLDEASDTLTRYRDTLDLDPERLAEADARIARLHELARKHRVRMPELKAHAATLREELDALRGAGASIAAQEEQARRHAAAWREAAARLTRLRLQTASALGTAVTGLMAELGMVGGHFEIALEANASDAPDALGAERCEFLVSANPGQPPRALRKVASGGELSRIGLAIEVAALAGDHPATMVFDEVDAGIGGATAEIVGQKLRALGERCQVLCVTHLPQVAAQAHRQLRVRKISNDGQTATAIERLDEKGREDEIARMLGGVDITRETRAHARQMLAGNGKR